MLILFLFYLALSDKPPCKINEGHSRHISSLYREHFQIDLSALFQARQPAMSNEEATRFAEDWNEDLEKMEVSSNAFKKLKCESNSKVFDKMIQKGISLSISPLSLKLSYLCTQFIL